MFKNHLLNFKNSINTFYIYKKKKKVNKDITINIWTKTVCQRLVNYFQSL